jgi:pimeloyl-ACP methyl ester carboxylesterase
VSVALVLSGCASVRRTLGFRHQADQVRQWARVDGHIDVEGGSQGTLVVVLARPGASDADPPTGVDSYVRLHPGSYAFPVAPGDYLVGAWEDRNTNGLLDPGEKVRSVRASPRLEVGAGERIGYDVRLSSDEILPASAQPEDVLGLSERTPAEQARFSLWAFSAQGRLSEDLSDPAFGPAAATRGLWEIMDFVNDGLAGVHFLEAYDPDRIPVLFVHGIAGHPQQLAALMQGLDGERFQPWFYFYPSGFPLGALARHLATLLKRLQAELGFGELAIVAHSMGGLVARGAVFEYWDETHRDDVRLLVTLATPWGGMPKAEGAARAPVELPPVFQDVAPSSDFLRSLFYAGEAVRELPEGVEFHLVFGFRMSRRANLASDGTVSVASQMRPEAQAQAASIRGLDRGHVAILDSPEAREWVNGLLARRFD